jgi:asparagine synthase (glutamine-hydrolysing)
MCGIYGLIQAHPFDRKELIQMSELLRHRGPDDEGILLIGKNSTSIYGGKDTPSKSYTQDINYCPRETIPDYGMHTNGGIALGHRRLAIIDLTANGHQPMSFRNRYWITYNGEVYNYLEIRTELQLIGYTFNSNTDTEVILAAYDYWGESCLSRFNGMWSFAIFDTLKNKAFLARDRFGVKPLYLRLHKGRLAFSSEIKAFTALKDWQPIINQPRLIDMVVWNVLDHTEQTMFDGIIQLPAGHSIEIELDNIINNSTQLFDDNIILRQWYNLSSIPATPTKSSDLYDLLNDAVRLRLRADVPIGSCLSGGLDSSAIVCLMSEQLESQRSTHKLRTFTACSHDAQYDESRYAKEVAEKSKSIGHYITPEPTRLFDELSQLIWHQDEPFSSTSIFAQWCVFENASTNKIKVMLDGQGADEILCGYRGYFGAYLANLLKQGKLRLWADEVKAMNKEISFSYHRSAGYTLAYLFPQLIQLLGRFDGRSYANRDWLNTSAMDMSKNDPLRIKGARDASVRNMSIAQLTATNLPMLLHWEDRNSMAFSVEARVPFLDYRVVELCLNMNDTDKLGGGMSKTALRKNMRNLVPDNILDRRDKLGFVTAESLWIKRDRATEFRLLLANAVDLLPNLFSGRIIDQYDQFIKGESSFDQRYWSVICAGQWAKSHKFN